MEEKHTGSRLAHTRARVHMRACTRLCIHAVVGNIDKDLRERERDRKGKSERRRKRLNIAVCSLLISCLDFCGKAVCVCAFELVCDQFPHMFAEDEYLVFQFGRLFQNYLFI